LFIGVTLQFLRCEAQSMTSAPPVFIRECGFNVSWNREPLRSRICARLSCMFSAEFASF